MDDNYLQTIGPALQARYHARLRERVNALAEAGLIARPWPKRRTKRRPPPGELDLAAIDEG